ncbi:uncharacterized protein [Antennarius striatus]|uniref:uncharacterized protein n=1 Tax=Antennarius striatus TaxID=241820 RepID=UPI0035B04A14
MWDARSCFTTQTSAWYDTAAVSGASFLSKVGSTSSGNSGSFKQKYRSLKKMQSLYHLRPKDLTPSFPPSVETTISSPRETWRLREAGVGQWLQDAHKHLDTQIDRLMARNSQFDNILTATQQLDMKHKQQSGVMRDLEQEKEALDLPSLEKRQQLRELHEKVLQLEKELLPVKSTLDQSNEVTLASLGRTLPLNQKDLNRQEGQNIDTVLHQLREALRNADARAKKHEEERNQALQELHTSTEVSFKTWKVKVKFCC